MGPAGFFGMAAIRRRFGMAAAIRSPVAAPEGQDPAGWMGSRFRRLRISFPVLKTGTTFS
ncbi:hypothetical protein EV668_4273 [Enterovirga rhinocerotis]|uniref:Uncharacterized protein n=1 Tax=Enterovirga rhinocerotis TaxID=1339210 RepID=A0A4R7BPX6_9HYPH|nr:hypothetical protein EV668_4273 [Enterovirga rhinocerotis]